MKKLTTILMTMLIMLTLMPSSLKSAPDKGKVTVAAGKTVEPAGAQALITRLEVIKAMDVSNLSPVEKRQLRKEVRSIKGTLNEMHGEVIYISAGGLIVLLLLVIILF